MPELEVVKVPTEDLLEYQNNAKLHPSEQVDQIAESIEEFGFNNPILAWHNDDGEPEIVAGHGRLMAARKLGLEELPVVFLDHMSEEQRSAYIIVDNSTNLSSGFDMEILSVELDAIADIDMEQFGVELDVPEVGEITNGSKEIDVESFDDDKFEHECPRCGFRFNE
jgi:ParB-like chromosome segregation protein Spo0J